MYDSDQPEPVSAPCMVICEVCAHTLCSAWLILVQLEIWPISFIEERFRIFFNEINIFYLIFFYYYFLLCTLLCFMYSINKEQMKCSVLILILFKFSLLGAFRKMTALCTLWRTCCLFWVWVFPSSDLSFL